MPHFSQFTQKYSLSKSLKFELKPIGRTQKFLDENKVFLIDENIKNKYILTKPFIDELHRDFIKESLKNISLSGLDEFEKAWKEYKKDKKGNEKEYKKISLKFRKEIESFFDSKGKNWAEKYASSGLKNTDREILFEEGIFKVLEIRYGEDTKTHITDNETGEITSIFSGWKGFTGYFIKFFETRRNYYKNDGTSTAISTRIIDQNLSRFLENRETFQKLQKILSFNEIKISFPDFMNIGEIEYYNNCLLQSGIDTYNAILGGYTKEDGTKIKGINELINLYRQSHSNEKISFLKPLDKQIGSEKIAFLKTIDNPEEFRIFFKEYVEKSQQKIEILKKSISEFLSDPLQYNLDEIFLSKESLNTITRKWLSQSHTFEKALYEVMKKIGAKYDSKEDLYKFPDSIPISSIQSAFEKIEDPESFWKERYQKTEENKNGVIAADLSIFDAFIKVFTYEFDSLFYTTQKNETGSEIIVGYNGSYNNTLTLIKDPHYDLNKAENKTIIKSFADDTLRIYQMGKYFTLEKKRKWNPENLEVGEFYTHPEYGYEVYYDDAYKIIVQGYNDIRNYLTKNPWSEDKWKLNFQNPTLANGWDKNKESDNSCILLKKGNKIFLGLMSRGNNQIFDERNVSKFNQNIESGKYEKMIYKFFPDQAKMFPKVCFSTKGLEFFKPSDEIYRIYKNAEFKKGDTFEVNSMRKLIDFYKDCLGKYEGWKCYDFRHIKPTNEYSENIGEFFKDVAQDSYIINFQDISESYIQELTDSGKLYLFEISNQDFGEGKTGKKNLHTLYFEHIFSKENMEANFPIKLNGQAEIFFRPNSIKSKSEKRNFSREIITKKRYTEDKIFFHVPLTFNRTKGDIYGFNTEINNFVINNPDINIIGIDRGEKHLAYYTVIDQKGNILLDENGNSISESLNYVNNTNYGEKLSESAEKRNLARQDWKEVEGIKNLKSGYISAVVHKLTDLVIKHNAIIIFEDLNMRFKQIRGGIEKSVYQQLEKALIEKLSFLVDKGEMDSTKAGHLLNAYQLTAPFTTFQDMGKQTGIIFYTQAAYTSKIDPVTGWRPHLYLKYTNADHVKKEILKFSKILWNDQENRYEFTYDIKNFLTQKEYPNNTIWTICSHIERYRWDKNLNQNKGAYQHYANLTDPLDSLFDEFGIKKEDDILRQISALESKGNEKFFKSFIFFFSLICQIRNTNKNDTNEDNQDFILSPVFPFFDSRDQGNKEKKLPKNGDENGAYNIARKGLIILEKINQYAKENGNCEKLSWGDLSISNNAWDNFIHR